MERALRSSSSSSSPALGWWGECIGRINAHSLPLRRVGILHPEHMETQAASVLNAIARAGPGGGSNGGVESHEPSLLSASEAESDSNAFASWLCSCDRVVLVVGRIGIVQTLAGGTAYRRALGIHPRVYLVVDGLDPGSPATSLLAGLLRESLALCGVPAAALDKVPSPIVSLDDLCCSDTRAVDDQTRVALDELASATPVDDTSQRGLLAGVLGAALAAAEAGGAAVFAPTLNSATGGASAARPSPRLLAFLEHCDGGNPEDLSPLSRRIQRSFEDGDLSTVDASVGAIKQRVLWWFGSREIWRSVLMRVSETADALVEDAILDRSFEEADLGMAHAAGRLSESVQSTASEFADALDALCQAAPQRTYGASTQHCQSTLMSARKALQALALQKESVDPAVLARHVWAARMRLSESDVLGGVPSYIRWSLAQFWAIHGAALAGPAACAIYLGVPLPYVAAGGVGLAALAFGWLARRWALLRTRLCQHVDAQGAALREDLLAAHKSALQARLDGPIRSRVGDAAGLLRPALRGPSRPRAAPGAEETLAAWKARLASAAQ